MEPAPPPPEQADALARQVQALSRPSPRLLWLGLGTVDLQTASGRASAELSIVGLEEHEQVRDFLYLRMRGLRDAREEAAGGRTELVALLEGIRADLAAVRRALAAREEGQGGGHG